MRCARRWRPSRLLHDMPKPTIAMVNGVAAGAGLSLALACDLRIAGRSARMTTAFAKVGLSGDYGGTWFLTQLVGTAKARELYFLSDVLDAARIEALGLANRVVADAELAGETMALAERLANGPAIALRYMKRNLNVALLARCRRAWTAKRTACCAAVPATTTRKRRAPSWRSVRRRSRDASARVKSWDPAQHLLWVQWRCINPHNRSIGPDMGSMTG